MNVKKVDLPVERQEQNAGGGEGGDGENLV